MLLRKKVILNNVINIITIREGYVWANRMRNIESELCRKRRI